MRGTLRLLAAGLLAAFWTGAASAQDGVLTITDGTQTVELTREQLNNMEQDVIETSLPWLEKDPAHPEWPKGVHKFSGPSLTTILNEAGMSGETVTVEALDGYGIQVPRERLTGDGAILATSMDDQDLPEKQAPYWIIFPYDESPEMADADHASWSVWAVGKMSIEQ
jgi:hypothetical protein